MIITEEVYLAHYGTKGMKWGQRKAQVGSAARTVGRVGWAGAKMTGRGTKRAAIWSKENPKAAATIAVGAVIAGNMIRGKVGQTKLNAINDETWRIRGKAIAENSKLLSSQMKLESLGQATSGRLLYKTTFRG